MTKDPVGFEAGGNFYGYASGDPVNRTDPFGDNDRTNISEQLQFADTTIIRDTVKPTGDTIVPANYGPRLHAWNVQENRSFFGGHDARNYNGSVLSYGRPPLGTNQVHGTIGGDFQASLVRSCPAPPPAPLPPAAPVAPVAAGGSGGAYLALRYGANRLALSGMAAYAELGPWVLAFAVLDQISGGLLSQPIPVSLPEWQGYWAYHNNGAQ
jgi:hypothetical protein